MMEELSTAVERHFCKMIDESPRDPLDEETSTMLISLIFADNAAKKIPEPEMSKITGSLGYRIFVDRVRWLGYEPSVMLGVFISTVVETPGDAVMHATYMCYKAKQLGQKEVDLDLFCRHAYPMGMPSKETWDKAWDSQKAYGKEFEETLENPPTGNLIDAPEALASIR